MSKHPTNEDCSYYCQGTTHAVVILIERQYFDDHRDITEIMLEELRAIWLPKGWHVCAVRPSETTAAMVIQQWCQSEGTLTRVNRQGALIFPSVEIDTASGATPYLVLMEAL